FVRGGVDNGAWFHDRALYVINEHTHLLKDFVDHRSCNDWLSEVEPTAKPQAASAALLKARPGFVVEQMAAEPLVQDPIALAFGADGKLWVVEMGDYPLGADGKGKGGGRVRSAKSGVTVDIRGHDFRFRPDTGELEAVTGQSQYGRCRDDWGTWFGGNNSNPAWHFALDDHYLRRNPHFAPPDPRSRVP